MFEGKLNLFNIWSIEQEGMIDNELRNCEFIFAVYKSKVCWSFYSEALLAIEYM